MGLFSIKMTDYSKEVKARYIAPFCYILMVMAYFNSYLYFTLFKSKALALICLLCGAAATTVPFLKRTLRSHHFFANFVIVVFLICATSLGLYTGGIHSNAIWWLGTIPLLASFLLNAFYGVVWFIVIMLVFLSILMLEKMGMMPVNLLTGIDPTGRIVVSFTLNSILIFILCVLTDLIRDRAFLDREELRLKSFQLNQLASLGKLASGVAHEINNPLTVIRGAQLRIARMVEDNAEVDKKVLTDYMEKIHKNIIRIQEVTSLMRTISEKGIDRTISEINLQKMLVDITQMFREEAKEEKIEIVTMFENEIVFRGIYTEIFQAFFNIIENAVSELRETEGEKKLTLSLEQNIREIVIFVQDTGRGISPYIRDHIFDPFFTTKSFGSGKGLGLSFSYNVFTSNGGTLELVDTEKGTVFKITLPTHASFRN